MCHNTLDIIVTASYPFLSVFIKSDLRRQRANQRTGTQVVSTRVMWGQRWDLCVCWLPGWGCMLWAGNPPAGSSKANIWSYLWDLLTKNNLQKTLINCSTPLTISLTLTVFSHDYKLIIFKMKNWCFPFYSTWQNLVKTKNTPFCFFQPIKKSNLTLLYLTRHFLGSDCWWWSLASVSVG